MEITISINNNKEILKIPVVPQDVTISYPMMNETRDSIKYGQIIVPGVDALATLSWDSFFPVKKYSFASDSNGIKNFRWIRDNRKKKKIFRVVITSDKSELFNRLMVCDQFDITHMDGSGNIYYSISFTQYRKVT